jgi:hypothetical protein
MIEPNRPYPNGALRKFPDHQDGAQDESNVQQGFNNSAAFLLRAYQQSISRFELIVHKFFVVDAIRYASGVPQKVPSHKLLTTMIM